MDPIRTQDHPKLAISQEQCRETTPDTTACTDEKKASAVSMSEQEDLSGKATTNSAEEQLNSLQNRANRVVQEAGFEKSRENAWRQSVEQHRAEHGEKKQKLRRRRLLLDADRIQDQEPMHVSPFNALPHFEYLEIAQAVETDLPPALIRFGSLGLSTTEITSDKYTNQPYVPQGNLLCIFMTCPIQSMHCEGPYHHNNELGDQDHPYFKGSNPPPYIWRAYERMMQGISSAYEDEMLGGFWAWHVPPFCVVPEMADASSNEHNHMEL